MICTTTKRWKKWWTRDKRHILSLTIGVNIIFPYLNCHNFDKAHISSISTTVSVMNSENRAVIRPFVKNSLQVHDHVVFTHSRAQQSNSVIFNHFCHELPTCWHTKAQDAIHRLIYLFLHMCFHAVFVLFRKMYHRIRHTCEYVSIWLTA